MTALSTLFDDELEALARVSALDPATERDRPQVVDALGRGGLESVTAALLLADERSSRYAVLDAPDAHPVAQALCSGTLTDASLAHVVDLLGRGWHTQAATQTNVSYLLGLLTYATRARQILHIEAKLTGDLGPLYQLRKLVDRDPEDPVDKALTVLLDARIRFRS